MNDNLNSDRLWPIPERSWFMRMKWHDLLFIHYPVPVASLRKLIPGPLEIDTFAGQAWIGIVPFRMSGVSPRWMPDLPWMSRFPELNVRTYVTVNDRPGVWFFSLDATNPVAVRGARYLFHLKYMDAMIDISSSEEWFEYRSVRTHRGEPKANLRVDYRPIGRSFFAEPGSLEHWLTARYCLYTADRNDRVLRGEIEHPPWALRNAQAVIHENSMLNGLDIAVPDVEPLLHFAEETSVVAWSNERVQSL